MLQHYAQCELLPRDSACTPDVSVAKQFRQHLQSSGALAAS
jgi:chorismate synthase